jgi:hypothetical protein
VFILYSGYGNNNNNNNLKYFKQINVRFRVGEEISGNMKIGKRFFFFNYVLHNTVCYIEIATKPFQLKLNIVFFICFLKH